MIAKKIIISLLTILAAVLTCASAFFAFHQKPTLIVAKPSNDADAFMENVTATIYSKSGTPSLKIETPKMAHFADNDTMQIQKPHVTVYRKSPNPWHIDSDYAITLNGAEQINFLNHVVIHHPGDIADPTTTMNTESLTIIPDKQIAQTDKSITITQPDTIIHAIGMLADMNEGSVKLLSQAKGEYVPNS